jgi:hypothetical protein
MVIEDFTKEFHERVLATAATDGNFSRSAFSEASLLFLEEAGQIADFTPCYFKGNGFKGRSLEIDAYSFDEVDDSLSIFLADYHRFEGIDRITRSDATKLFAKLSAFVDEANSGRLTGSIEDSHPAFSFALELRQRKASLTRLRLYLLTDAAMSDLIKDLPEGMVSGVPADFHIWDIARFHRSIESPVGRDELEIDFANMVPGGLPCLAASVESNDYRAYLCVVPATILAGAYEKFGSRLLEGNVRAFLSTKVKVNKNIRKTILTEPEMFFAYNNGIACTASSATVIRDAGALRLTHVKDLQIVNGGQTTASLANAHRLDKANLDGIFVQMKLSVVLPEKSGDVIPSISVCANSQNKVSDADFFSNHEFHRRIESFSRRIWAPAVAGAQHETHWFYERARGQFLNEQSTLSKRDRDRFLLQNPRKQLVTKTDLAKYENAWRLLPNKVSLGAQKNFTAFSDFATSEWERSPDQFNEEYFRDLVAKAILYRRTEELVSDQPWYDGGFRANIVAYTISKLVSLTRGQGHGQKVDLQRIWQRQSVSDVLAIQLMRIAERVLRVIVDPPAGMKNVTEWCKKELCWQRVLDLKIDLVPEIDKDLVLREEESARKKSSRGEQKVLNGIERQTLTFALGADYWKKLDAWGRQKGLITPDEMSILKVACAMPSKLPTDKQAWRLIEIKLRAEEEGFPVVDMQ